jgi:hypothetical protein
MKIKNEAYKNSWMKLEQCCWKCRAVNIREQERFTFHFKKSEGQETKKPKARQEQKSLKSETEKQWGKSKEQEDCSLKVNKNQQR